MSPTARTVLPTDLVALVSYDGRVYANEAVTLDRAGTHDSPHPLGTAFEQWFSFATGRHTWISVKGPTLRGLISARKRGSKLAWEIDCLINAEEHDAGVLMSLLDQVTDAAGRSGALKIFVRVASGAPAETALTRCGFLPYRQEQLFRLDATPADAVPAGIRRRARADLYDVFRLYNALVPEHVRRHEAMTLAEFIAAQERLGRATQYVLQGASGVEGWLRVAHDGDLGRFDIIAGPGVAAPLVAAALAKLAARSPICAIVPAFQEEVAACLAEAGFQPADEYTVFVRRTVRPVKDAARVPAVVQTTFG